jgi:hypothetical protein
VVAVATEVVEEEEAMVEVAATVVVEDRATVQLVVEGK